MLKKDAFSILIPFYNTGALTRELLDELFRQRETYPQTEIVLVDSGSTEDTSWLSEYKDLITTRVEPINGKSQGEAVSRNKCIDLAKCEWMAFVDSDDMVVSDYLDTIYENARKGFDYVVYSWVNTDGQRGDWHKESLAWNLNVWSYTYRRELIDKRFDERRYTFCDIFWLKEQLKPEWSRLVVDKPIIIYNGNRADNLTHLLARGEISVWREGL